MRARWRYLASPRDPPAHSSLLAGGEALSRIPIAAFLFLVSRIGLATPFERRRRVRGVPPRVAGVPADRSRAPRGAGATPSRNHLEPDRVVHVGRAPSSGHGRHR